MTVDDLYTLGASLVGGGGAAALIGGLLRSALKTALNAAVQDLQTNVSKHLTPNGGESAYDQITKTKDIAQKALEVSVANEARLKTLENKVDAIVLSRVS